MGLGTNVVLVQDIAAEMSIARLLVVLVCRPLPTEAFILYSPDTARDSIMAALARRSTVAADFLATTQPPNQPCRM